MSSPQLRRVRLDPQEFTLPAGAATGGGESGSSRATRLGPASLAPRRELFELGTHGGRTGQSFEVVAKGHDGQIVEENLMYNLVTFLKQIRLSESRESRTPRNAIPPPDA
jgi:hypothetical protein